MGVQILSSVTRKSDLASNPFETKKLPKDQWSDGDFVAGKVTGTPTSLYKAELASGRIVRVMPGDYMIGAFGHRAATLEGVGSWTSMTDDHMEAMTSAGLFGKFTSLSPLLPAPIKLRYDGHVVRDGKKIGMSDFTIKSKIHKLATPVVLLVGTSMSAGKTTAGRLIVHELTTLGLKVIGAKLTGAGRYRDVLSFKDAGATEVFDFVDAGLPSTVVEESMFLDAIKPLLGHMASLSPDVLVIESGASPLEPYNGAAAIKELGNNICCSVLCASDPYAVVGVKNAFGMTPDLVTGPAANTSAGIKLVKELTGVDALNILDPDCTEQLRQVLSRTLGSDLCAWS